MQKLDGCDSQTAVAMSVIKEQILENSKLGLTNLYDSPDYREGKEIAIVGGGPSLKDNLDKLRAFKGPIIACGSVHDFLVENNINFNYCVVCDPDPLVTQYMKHRQSEVKYLIASQCHPETFSHLMAFKNYIWHCHGTQLGEEFWPEGTPIFGGGCTVGTRALIIAMSFGYCHISLFGFDSSLDKNFKHHSYDFQTENETIGNISEIRLQSPTDSKVFYCAGYMVAQLFDIKKLLEVYAGRLDVKVIGDGALSHMFKLGMELKQSQEVK